jgi:hypothetical protein
MPKIKHIISFCALFAFVAIFSNVGAQTGNTGALTGVVSDTNGAIVSGAQIKVTNEATGEERTVVTSETGSYTVPVLLPGSYRVEFSATGFKKSIKPALRVNVTETTRLDVQLEVGSVAEQVTVTSDATLLQTESSALGRVADSTIVSNLPLVTRNYTQIVTLSPGISAPVTRGDELGRGTGGESGGNFRSQGAFLRDNNFQLNGIQSNDLQASGSFSGGIPIPNPDAIQEFKVQTGQYDATFGRNAGANVNLVTKSGGNDFHGSAFEFFRNDALNANDFFRNRNGQPRGILRQNQFGFVLGGPIIKEKINFFGSYQGTRQTNGVGTSSTTSVTTPPFSNDRSRAALGALYANCTPAPACRTSSNGIVVAPDGSNISPQALALLNFRLPNGSYVIPTPQRINAAAATAAQGFSTFSVPGTFDEDQYLINLDFIPSAKSKLYGRFFSADSTMLQPIPPSQLPPPVPGFPFLLPNNFLNLSIGYVYTFSSNFVNQLDVGFNRTKIGTLQQEAFTYADIGVNAPPIANKFPVISVNGSAATGGNGQSVRVDQNHFTIQDSATYLWGRHTLRFGGGITNSKVNLKDFTFFGALLFLSWPDLLIGQAGNIFLTLDLPGDLDRSWHVFDGNGYIQDDFKVTSSLTLNLGLRYERFGHLADTGGRNSGFDISLANPNPSAGGTLAGFEVSNNYRATIPTGVTQLDNRLGINGDGQDNFGPRVGFAWKLPHTFLPFTDRMVLRGGYGMYQTRATGQAFLQLATGQPFASLRQLQGAPAAGATFANPFQPVPTLPAFIPYSPTTNLSINLVDPHYRPPITQHWSLNLQTDLGHGYLLETGYVGSRGTHLIFRHSQNQALLASAANPIRGVTTNTAANARLRVPILGFTSAGLLDIDSAANSWYHSAEISVTKRLSQGLQFLAAYTFARGYDDVGGATDASGTGGGTGNQANRRANYGLDNREHRFVLSAFYNFPNLKYDNSVANAFLHGWALSGVSTIQSGLPLSLTGTNASNAFGTTSDRVQLVSGCTYDQLATSGSVIDRLGGLSGGPGYFNRACVQTGANGLAAWPLIEPGGGTIFGTSGVGIIVGPGQNNTDLAVIKRTSIGWLKEGANVEFRTEFFNAFNTPQFNNPSTNASSAAFGQITSASVSPRIIQFGLKVNF